MTDSETTTGDSFAGFQHEAGDRAFVVGQHFNDFVQSHPFIKQRAELEALADQVSERLAELYQAIWRVTE